MTRELREAGLAPEEIARDELGPKGPVYVLVKPGTGFVDQDSGGTSDRYCPMAGHVFRVKAKTHTTIARKRSSVMAQRLLGPRHVATWGFVIEDSVGRYFLPHNAAVVVAGDLKHLEWVEWTKPA
ncbi:MAG TPA: hypothetical protein VKA48_07725 [Gammaproteobacteria bacterium]|nr:hypothetical protein [Gammaproteobacteria bacterium]